MDANTNSIYFLDCDRWSFIW